MYNALLSNKLSKKDTRKSNNFAIDIDLNLFISPSPPARPCQQPGRAGEDDGGCQAVLHWRQCDHQPHPGLDCWGSATAPGHSSPGTVAGIITKTPSEHK